MYQEKDPLRNSRSLMISHCSSTNLIQEEASSNGPDMRARISHERRQVTVASTIYCTVQLLVKIYGTSKNHPSLRTARDTNKEQKQKEEY
jgi:hypothetical protein